MDAVGGDMVQDKEAGEVMSDMSKDKKEQWKILKEKQGVTNDNMLPEVFLRSKLMPETRLTSHHGALSWVQDTSQKALIPTIVQSHSSKCK